MHRIEHHACFGGAQEVWGHRSAVLDCNMRLAIYLPPQAADGPCPVLYWLSGLTCTEQNFITKAGAQRYAAEHGLILVAPDSSPRGPEVADDPGYDLGQGAGFYVNATQSPWAAHFQMYSYVVAELPALIEAHFPATQRRGICGHSMGGHGALVIGLREAERYASISAFSPIVAPSQVPWGRKALAAYLGADEARWTAFDACALVARERDGDLPAVRPLLVDQGEADEFLADQLQPQRLVEACSAAGRPLSLRLRPGYDHSYYFIASFIGEHIAHHAAALRR
jgi:S-formylglutathione hydrolase